MLVLFANELSTPPRSSSRAFNYEPVSSPDDNDRDEQHDDSDDGPITTSTLSMRRKCDDNSSNSNYLLWFIITIVLTSIVVQVGDRIAMTRSTAVPLLRTPESSLNTPATAFTSTSVAPPQHAEYRHDDPAAVLPHIAWLMSFPNSGTTYTIDMVTAATNTSTATNYGEEAGTANIPVHVNDTNGPFWKSTPPQFHNGYVMTKTHCGGRCTMCEPERYIETTRSFEVACRSGTRNPNNKVVMYNDNVVKRAIHLIRNPFDNMVARLHLDLRKWQKNNGTDRHGRIWPNFTSDREGLKAWCEHMDTQYGDHEEASRLVDSELYDMENGLPCHGEFYRYIQWHNQAIEVSARILKIPVLYLYYENYTTNFDETISTVLDFLNLPQVAPAPPFVKGKHYEDYLEPHDYQMGAQLIRELATDEAWGRVNHYVERYL
jgi:hypothetical protein